MSEPKINIPRDKIANFCKQNQVRRLSLFGSILREDFGPDSDVDILVEFEPGTRISVSFLQTASCLIASIPFLTDLILICTITY